MYELEKIKHITLITDEFNKNNELLVNKPLSNTELLNIKEQIIKKYDYIVTLEDMSEINGLASILKELAYKNKYKGNMITFSLKDKFLKNYGSQDDLLKMHGISSLKIFHKLKKLFKK